MDIMILNKMRDNYSVAPNTIISKMHLISLLFKSGTMWCLPLCYVIVFPKILFIFTGSIPILNDILAYWSICMETCRRNSFNKQGFLMFLWHHVRCVFFVPKKWILMWVNWFYSGAVVLVLRILKIHSFLSKPPHQCFIKCAVDIWWLNQLFQLGVF